MLEIFKQQKSFLTRAKEKSSFKYLLTSDHNGAYIEVCDNKLKPLTGVDYRVYNGIDREILQFLESCKQEEFYTISWEDSGEHLYLDKHPRLLELLKSSDKIVNKENISLTFEKIQKRLTLTIVEENDTFQSSPTLDGESDFVFLNSRYVVLKTKIIPIDDVGEYYLELNSFDTKGDIGKIEEFLSLFVSHFENINIDFEPFVMIFKEEKKLIKPAVIFESITSDNELVLVASATIGNLKPDFFNNFQITKIALLNQIEQQIELYECDFSLVFETYGEIYKNLGVIRRKHKEGNFSEDDGMFVIDETIAKEFIEEYLHSLIVSCELFGSEKLKSYRYNANKPSLHVAFKNKIDFLGLDDVTVSLGEESFGVFDLINLYKKHSYIPLSNGEKSILDRSYINKLERIFKKNGKDKIEVSFFDLPEIEELIAQKEQKVFKESREFYDRFNALKDSKTRLPKLQGVELRDYQKVGVRWLYYLYENNFGGCLADDMGLGKTLQAITLLSMIYPKSELPSLIVMPKSLLVNWQNELKKFNPNLSFALYYESSRDIESIKNAQIILTTYAIVRNDIDKLKEIKFDTIILDESQNIKNIESKISRAVMLLEGEHKFALSGTPIENSLFELYSLFRFINSGMFRSLSDFKKDYALPIQTDANEEVAKILKAKITPFLLRRLKKDVLKDLPSKQEQVVYIDMDDEHKRFYNEKKAYYKQMLSQQITTNGIESSRFAILQAFNDLRQIASAPSLKSEKEIPSSKIEALFEMLEDIVANNHKVLVFANFLGSLDIISAKADELGIEHLMMTGSTKNRQELVDRFQNDKSIKLFLMTLKVGGVGLNLTEADYVFIFDPWWNKSAQNQAIDRAHRMGQKNTVFSYELITKDTIEEKILELQNQKKDMTDMIISGEDGGLKQLSLSDLEYILG